MRSSSPITHPRTLLVTEVRLCAWLGQAASGEELTYHRGHLALDRDPANKCLCEPERAELARLSQLALRASELGWVHLVQRRDSADGFSYMMVARRMPRTGTATVQTLLCAGAA